MSGYSLTFMGGGLTVGELKKALDGMVDRRYEELTDTVQANGDHHIWKELVDRRKTLGPVASLIGLPDYAARYVKMNSTEAGGHYMSDVTRLYMGLQILDDVGML